MKIGYRKPSIKRSVSARTTGKLKRTIKRSINPTYGKKGMGYINNPSKAVYNKVYNKTTTSISPASSRNHNSYVRSGNISFDTQKAITLIKQLRATADIINNTTNVSTFFSRYNFALQICDELSELEYTGCFNTISPLQQKRDLIAQLPEVLNTLITRCYNKELIKSQELKTETGRHNRMVRFFNNIVSELKQYGVEYITETNISKLNELAKEYGVSNEVEINLNPVVLPSVEVSKSSNFNFEIDNAPNTLSASPNILNTPPTTRKTEVNPKKILYRVLAIVYIVCGIAFMAMGVPFIGIILIIAGGILLAKFL